MIHGDDLIVAIKDVGAIGASKSCSVNVTMNFIDVCAPTDIQKKKIPTDYTWGIDCGCLVVNTEDAAYFLDAIKNGTEFDLRWFVGGLKQGGKAFVSTWKISGNKGSLMTFNLSFVGSGSMDDCRAEGWDFHHGVLYTYANFDTGTLNTGGYVTEGSLSKTQPSNS